MSHSNRKPHYIYSHFCMMDAESKTLKIFEIQKGIPWDLQILGNPICQGSNLGEVLRKANELGIPSYLIKVVSDE